MNNIKRKIELDISIVGKVQSQIKKIEKALKNFKDPKIKFTIKDGKLDEIIKKIKKVKDQNIKFKIKFEGDTALLKKISKLSKKITIGIKLKLENYKSIQAKIDKLSKTINSTIKINTTSTSAKSSNAGSSNTSSNQYKTNDTYKTNNKLSKTTVAPRSKTTSSSGINSFHARDERNNILGVNAMQYNMMQQLNNMVTAVVAGSVGYEVIQTDIQRKQVRNMGILLGLSEEEIVARIKLGEDIRQKSGTQDFVLPTMITKELALLNNQRKEQGLSELNEKELSDLGAKIILASKASGGQLDTRELTHAIIKAGQNFKDDTLSDILDVITITSLKTEGKFQDAPATFAEYSKTVSEGLGLSIKDFGNILIGLQADGVLNSDRIGAMLQEFTTSMSSNEGASKEALGVLGYNTEEQKKLRKTYIEGNKEEKKQIFTEIVSRISTADTITNIVNGQKDSGLGMADYIKGNKDINTQLKENGIKTEVLLKNLSDIQSTKKEGDFITSFDMQTAFFKSMSEDQGSISVSKKIYDILKGIEKGDKKYMNFDNTGGLTEVLKVQDKSIISSKTKITQDFTDISDKLLLPIISKISDFINSNEDVSMNIAKLGTALIVFFTGIKTLGAIKGISSMFSKSEKSLDDIDKNTENLPKKGDKISGNQTNSSKSPTVVGTLGTNGLMAAAVAAALVPAYIMIKDKMNNDPQFKEDINSITFDKIIKGFSDFGDRLLDVLGDMGFIGDTIKNISSIFKTLYEITLGNAMDVVGDVFNEIGDKVYSKTGGFHKKTNEYTAEDRARIRKEQEYKISKKTGKTHRLDPENDRTRIQSISLAKISNKLIDITPKNTDKNQIKVDMKSPVININGTNLDANGIKDIIAKELGDTVIDMIKKSVNREILTSGRTGERNY